MSRVKKVTVIGLGKTGTLLAGAFSEKPDLYEVIGCDPERSAEQRAEREHRVSRIEHDPSAAVTNADLILLTVPPDLTEKVLECISGNVRDDVVILDSCPCKAAAAALACRYLKHPEIYLGIWPGAAALSHKAFLFIAADPGTSEKAIREASALSDLLGMERFFIEPLELDGLIAAVYDLPLLAANGLMGCIARQPGWKDGQKAAEETLIGMTDPLCGGTGDEAPETAFLNNRENTVRMLDEYIAELSERRDLLDQGDRAGLRDRLESGRKIREQWLGDQRQKNKDKTVPSGMPAPAEMMAHTFFGGLLRKKDRN